MEQTAKVIVITGASSGIGAALAKQLGSRGASLVLGARRTAELEAVARNVSEGGVPALSVPTDVTIRGDVERLRDAAISHFGHVDVWVNNAGRGITMPVLQLTDEQFDGIMSVNVKSALYGMQAIVPHFQQRNAGHVINVSSFLSRVPIATFRAAYNAAKAALNQLTANLRMDLRREYPGIHVSLVMPGIVTTEFAQNALGGTPVPRPAGSGGQFQVQTADEAASAIVDLIDHPRAEIYTNPRQAEIVKRYFDDVGAFEQSMGG